MRIDEPLDRGLAAEARPALQQCRDALRRILAGRDLELAIQTAQDALDALPRGADQPADAVIGHAETQVDQHREFEIAEVPRRRVSKLLTEHFRERDLIDEYLLHRILGEPLRHRALVEEAPHGRPTALV